MLVFGGVGKLCQVFLFCLGNCLERERWQQSWSEIRLLFWGISMDIDQEHAKPGGKSIFGLQVSWRQTHPLTSSFKLQWILTWVFKASLNCSSKGIRRFHSEHMWKRRHVWQTIRYTWLIWRAAGLSNCLNIWIYYVNIHMLYINTVYRFHILLFHLISHLGISQKLGCETECSLGLAHHFTGVHRFDIFSSTSTCNKIPHDFMYHQSLRCVCIWEVAKRFEAVLNSCMIMWEI